MNNNKDKARKRACASTSVETQRVEDATPAQLSRTSARSLLQSMAANNTVLIRKSTDQTNEWTEYYLCDSEPGMNHVLLVAKDDILDTIQIKIVPGNNGG
jgi:hypothetical protein